jgi:hypothetical protein
MQVLRTTALAAAAAVAFVPTPPGERAIDTVWALSALGPRPAGSVAEARAGELVRSRFRSLGYRVVVQPCSLPRGGTSRNVVALSSGPVRAVVVAHLDGVSAGPAANDNASGVAVLLEAARALRGERGVLLAALGAEERVETGSRLHLGSVRLLRGISAAGRRRIAVALSLDMVGVGTRLHVRGIEAVPNRSARVTLAQARALDLRATYLPDPGWSDHAELSRGGVPAAWIQWREDACWHSACDRPGRVDPRKLAETTRLTVAAVRTALGAG